MTEPLSRPTETARNGMPWPSWLARAALVVLALSIAAAQAPARVKLLGLFAVAVGGAMGAVAAYFTRPHPDRIARRWLLAMFLMAFTGLVGSTWMAFRVEAAEMARLEAAWRPKSPEQQLAESMADRINREANAQSGFSLEEFREYLARRVKQLGAWSSPWPELFWILELLAGGTAAAWGFRFGADQSHGAVQTGEASP